MKPSWIETAIKLHEFQHRIKQARFMVVKDVGTIVLDGVEVTLAKGVEVEVPLWAARVLEERGIGNRAEPGLSIEDITRIHFSVMNARSPADLEPLPRDFYFDALDYIEELSNRIRREFNAALLEERQRAIQYFLEILDKRLSLILQSVKSPAALAEIAEKLSPEEAALLDELRRDIEAWRGRLSPKES